MPIYILYYRIKKNYTHINDKKTTSTKYFKIHISGVSPHPRKICKTKQNHRNLYLTYKQIFNTLSHKKLPCGQQTLSLTSTKYPNPVALCHTKVFLVPCHFISQAIITVHNFLIVMTPDKEGGVIFRDLESQGLGQHVVKFSNGAARWDCLPKPILSRSHLVDKSTMMRFELASHWRNANVLYHCDKFSR